MAQEKKVSTVADIGTVKIADDVVAMIAAFAALDVEGVASLPGDVTREMISKGGMKKIAKSVRVDVTRDGVKAELSIIVEYGYNIPTTSSRVQKRVKNAIEEMTGLVVIDVDIHISGICIICPLKEQDGRGCGAKRTACGCSPACAFRESFHEVRLLKGSARAADSGGFARCDPHGGSFISAFDRIRGSGITAGSKGGRGRFIFDVFGGAG